MKQILLIHGGNSYSSYDTYINELKTMPLDYERLKVRSRWSSWISEQLTDTDVLAPAFPNSDNAVFEEWRLFFKKILPFLGDDVQIVGHSLGAMFLAKYLNDTPLLHPIKRLVLISGAYNDDSNEDLGSFAVLSATNLPKSAHEIHLLHSKDDPVVPFTELAKFEADLPQATSHVLDGRGHFNDGTFPELLDIIK
jgi:predicted alpha/beta hydrolase family esterase